MIPGDVVSYLDMCAEEETSLQRGMNYRLKPGRSVILMSIRPGAPYSDRVEDDGRLLIYEGHDVPRKAGATDPKLVDQPSLNPSGSLTQNGLFFEAARRFKETNDSPELVRVYEKIRDGIWVYNGVFELIDAWVEHDGKRNVIKFQLRLKDDQHSSTRNPLGLDHSRVIPTSVKLEVWKRDLGRCVKCGNTKNLHYDHIIPFSKGGTSLLAENIQLLCAACNLAKHDNIE